MNAKLEDFMYYRVIFILFTGLLSGISQAAPQELYQARLPVDTRSETERKHHFTQAFTQVLRKLSGQQQQTPQVQTIEPFINEFYYETQAEQRWLVVHFDPDSIQQWAQQQGLSLWSTSRPTVLVWIVLDSAQPTLLNEEQHPQAVALLKNQAQQRGISILLPLVTLEELTLLSQLKTLRQPTEHVKNQIQERYGLKTILIAQLTSKAHWFLWLDDTHQQWQQSQQSLQQHLIQGLNTAVDHLAQHFAALTTKPLASVTIKVVGIPNLKTYAQVSKYLRNLDIITELELLSMHPEAIQFQLTVQGGVPALRQALSFEDRLLPVSQTNPEMIYRWLP
ncbi:MAG: DUF2066 domain-containing protein [Pseudomonadota bacterium]|nr:DUF2066 domain-containing protein [Pseudomonadota bacterium]